jgi:hypothetical protein
MTRDIDQGGRGLVLLSRPIVQVAVNRSECTIAQR